MRVTRHQKARAGLTHLVDTQMISTESVNPGSPVPALEDRQVCKLMGAAKARVRMYACSPGSSPSIAYTRYETTCLESQHLGRGGRRIRSLQLAWDTEVSQFQARVTHSQILLGSQTVIEMEG